MLAIGGVAAIAAPASAAGGQAAKKPAPSPSPTPTPTPAPTAGPTSLAIAGYTVTQTLDVSGSSAELVVPSLACLTAGEQALSIGLGAQAALGAPHTTAVVVVGCHGINAPFAFSRATVGSFVTTGEVASGDRVTFEITSSGGNAAATVRNQATGRSIVALAGAHDSSVTFGAFGVLGADSNPLSVPDFGTVTFAHNVFNGQTLSGGAVVTSPQVSTAAQDTVGGFSLRFLRS
jgi:hypothetical protein